MKNLLLLAPLFLSQLLFAQTPGITNLHYTYTENSYNRKSELVSKINQYNFAINGNALVMDRVVTPDRGYNRQIIDKQQGIIVSIRNSRKDFVIESLDSLYYPTNYSLVPTNETKIINGFNCRGYSRELTKNVKVTPDYAAVVVQGNGADYEYSYWITTDIKTDESYNPYIFGTLFQTHGLLPFEGVLVELDSKITYGKKVWTTTTVLDTAQLSITAEKLVFPWNEPKPGVALIQTFSMPSGTTTLFRAGDKTPEKQYIRMKQLLIKITGQEKPKFKVDLVTGIFW